MSDLPRIGFMQGRLSPPVNGMIQAFPRDHWKGEFASAQALSLEFMEWTIDYEGFNDNPLLTSQGQQEVRRLSQLHGISVCAVTGDCFMQVPFWKANVENSQGLKRDFINLVNACGDLGIQNIIVPLVDNGSLENRYQEDHLVDFMLNLQGVLQNRGVTIAFESDYEPRLLEQFIRRLPHGLFGVNYDIGNSAACGFYPEEEFSSYGDRICHVHIKDRLRGGPSVPLGEGHADFPLVFRLLREIGYCGYYVMQTARALDQDHALALLLYRNMVLSWIEESSH